MIQTPKGKSLGPDGFTTDFFHFCWNFIKAYVCKKVEESHKTMGVLHINLFRLVTMEEETFNIHLVDFPSKESNKGKDQSNIVHLCNRIKCLNVVNAFLLRESFHNQTSFVMLNSTIGGEFGLIYPSTLNNILSSRSRS